MKGISTLFIFYIIRIIRVFSSFLIYERKDAIRRIITSIASTFIIHLKNITHSQSSLKLYLAFYYSFL